VSYRVQTIANRCTLINTNKGLAHGELPPHQRPHSNHTPKPPALRTSVAWGEAAQEARKAVEAPLHREAGSTAELLAGSRRVPGRRDRQVDQDRVSRVRAGLRAT